MLIESTYSDDRWVGCRQCGWGGDITLDIVIYYDTEYGDWPCPECGAVNEYKNEVAWNGNDEYHDRMKEG